MLSLSKKMDYALLALAHLAKVDAARIVSTRELAATHEIPLELLAKILQRLAKAELIVSTPGPTGGYRLAKPADKIRIGDIVEIIDGAPTLVPCLRGDHNECEQTHHCSIQKPLARLNSRIFEMLNRVTLAEICRDTGEDTSITLTERSERNPLALTY